MTGKKIKGAGFILITDDDRDTNHLVARLEERPCQVKADAGQLDPVEALSLKLREVPDGPAARARA